MFLDYQQNVTEPNMPRTRHAALDSRNLRRNPGFASIAFLSLGLWIGANTAILSPLDRALLRTLPVKNPEQLVLMSANRPRAGSGLSNYDSDYTFSCPMYRDFRDRAHNFDGVIGWFGSAASLSLKEVAGVDTDGLIITRFPAATAPAKGAIDKSTG
jgi:putative ABC transport system permease protein